MIERLKFRGKATIAVPGQWIKCPEDVSVAKFFEMVELSAIDPSTVGQWTGLKDCKGVDVYEGDVVKVAGRDETPIVEFRDGVFGVEVMEEIQIPEDVVEGQEIFYALSDPEVRMGFDENKAGIAGIFYALEVIATIHDAPKNGGKE